MSVVAQDAASRASADQAAGLYLDLLKRSLTDLIFIDDPMSQMVPYRPISRAERLRQVIVGPLAAALRPFGIHAVRPNRQDFFDYSLMSPQERRDLRSRGQDWPPRAYTMVGLKRLDNLQMCVETVLRDGIPGDFIETGVWRGGASIFMKGVLKVHGDTARRVWLADSFRGLPAPDAERYSADRGWNLHRYDELAISRATVEANFRSYGLLDERVCFLEGWFSETLPTAPVEKLAVLRLDGDLYESTIQALGALYPKLSPGGFIIIDDYSLAPCRAAVEHYRRDHGITEPIVNIDGTGSYWRRTISGATDTPKGTL